MEKIHCPFHAEKTESCVIYETNYHCYGCGAHGPLSDLGRAPTAAPKERYKEDLDARRKEIEALPRSTHRGFVFPYNHRGYFITWPDCSYYKQRLFDPKDGESKYKCPAGQPQPLFWARRGAGRILALVEGELNSMSMAEAFPEWDVCSPGSASDFKTERFRKFLLTIARSYCTVIVQTDRDGAGTEAAIHTKGLLLNKVPNIPIVLMARDASEIYCAHGKDKLREEVERHLLPMQKESD